MATLVVRCATPDGCIQDAHINVARFPLATGLSSRHFLDCVLCPSHFTASCQQHHVIRRIISQCGISSLQAQELCAVLNGMQNTRQHAVEGDRSVIRHVRPDLLEHHHCPETGMLLQPIKVECTGQASIQEGMYLLRARAKPGQLKADDCVLIVYHTAAREPKYCVLAIQHFFLVNGLKFAVGEMMEARAVNVAGMSSTYNDDTSHGAYICPPLFYWGPTMRPMYKYAVFVKDVMFPLICAAAPHGGRYFLPLLKTAAHG